MVMVGMLTFGWCGIGRGQWCVFGLRQHGVGQLLGQKTVINEFVAYAEFGTLKNAGVQMDPKSVIIAVYALCGFSNFASISEIKVFNLSLVSSLTFCSIIISSSSLSSSF